MTLKKLKIYNGDSDGCYDDEFERDSDYENYGDDWGEEE